MIGRFHHRCLIAFCFVCGRLPWNLSLTHWMVQPADEYLLPITIVYESFAMVGKKSESLPNFSRCFLCYLRKTTLVWEPELYFWHLLSFYLEPLFTKLGLRLSGSCCRPGLRCRQLRSLLPNLIGSAEDYDCQNSYYYKAATISRLYYCENQLSFGLDSDFNCQTIRRISQISS